MTKWVFCFPGQGSQKVGMGTEQVANDADARAIFERANQFLGRDIRSICLDGPEEVLKQTENAQAGMFLVSACVLKMVERETSIRPSWVMGHSLGEITAYYAAGVFDLETALGVIQARGNAMSDACAKVPSEMAAVMGLELDAINVALKPFHAAPVVAANINSPNQIVISGASASMPAAIEALKAAGAKRVIPLPVAGAFHSPLMQPASEALASYLAKVTFNPPQVPIVLNRTARPCQDLAELTENLPQQVVSSVRWVESVSALASDPEVGFMECGPGTVLTGLIKKIAPESKTISIENPSNLSDAKEIL